MHSLTSDGRRYQLRVELVDASGKHFYQVDMTVDRNTHPDILIMFHGLSVHIHVIRVHTTKKKQIIENFLFKVLHDQISMNLFNYFILVRKFPHVIDK